ncbi:MAG TPA: acyl-CoA dehydrogenase family protein [Candidatus Dormibacteraeota bacterium]|nr:acyl-CoA dehydrogenase family protein [Candidatus Dormibacteraeota bacterium]
MDFALNDQQKLVRDTARQFMETELRPHLRQYEREEHFPAEEMRRLGELGFCGMLIPEEWGGVGADTVSYVAMLEEVARVDASTAVTLSVTNFVAGPLLRHGTQTQKERWLPRLASGEILGAFCLTEPEAGSDAGAIQARAERRGDRYVLNGTKIWVTNGGQAGLYIVFAKTDPGAGRRGVSAFLVEPGAPGFHIVRYEDKMGLRISHSAQIAIEDCAVDAGQMLGAEGEGLKIALSGLDSGRIGIAAQSVGVAQGALEMAVRYAKQRRAFGQAISGFQAIQWKLADMQTEIDAARMLVWQAAWLRDQGAGRLGRFSSQAKLYASEMANRVVYQAVQIHGSAGYSRESEIERFYRDARVLTIYEGTSEIQRLVIARDLLGGHDGRERGQ